MKPLKIFVCLVVLVISSVSRAQETITFDDLPARGFTTQEPVTYIPNGYGGLNWNNFAVANTTTFPESGFVNGTISGPNVAGTLTSGFPTSSPVPASITATSPFMLVSGYFTSAFLNNMNWEVIGIDATTTMYDENFTLKVTGPSFLTLPASDVTEVEFVVSGGTLPGPDYLGGAQLIIDNLTIAPVPDGTSTALLFVMGLGALALLRKSLVKDEQSAVK